MHKNMLPIHGGVFMVKNTTYFWRRSFCGQKHQSSLGGGRRRCFNGQKHENTSSKRRKQLGLEEEVISYTHIDDKNMSVFSSSILTVEYISKNGAWPYMPPPSPPPPMFLSSIWIYEITSSSKPSCFLLLEEVFSCF